MRLRSAYLVVAAYLAAGCSGLNPPAWMNPAPPAPTTASDYTPMAFSSVFDAAQAGSRAMVTALFDSTEDTVLDLPEQYAAGWLRVVVSDPNRPDSRSANVVVADRNRRYLSELARGQALDLYVTRTVHQDPMLANGVPTVILQVDQLRRHVAGTPAPALQAPGSAAVAAPPPADGVLEYGNAKRPEDRLLLMPDGKFEFRQYGKTIAGTYVLEGEKLTFILPNGKPALAKRSGDTVSDPAGNIWVLKSPLTK